MFLYLYIKSKNKTAMNYKLQCFKDDKLKFCFLLCFIYFFHLISPHAQLAITEKKN